LLHLPFPFKPDLGPHLFPSKLAAPASPRSLSAGCPAAGRLSAGRVDRPSEQALGHGKQLKVIRRKLFLANF